ncbi:Putative metal chaperone, involved in Zn homeostasis, GTPase of COG0523 family [Rhodovulum sp. PH10]|uniref:CobW family GTP-binding protein n=1 Tax=Rhodovulum sp. PH10 TaxID=1187851 RepID=UPI00027C20BA|nr:GTP-binding protein [Rhodovulum sp. PH10]EJW09690.1 Putative metal chaperone, involved in Zn homeostasis, GTPase of COG0523 family [Rhodovulum sp. PH10]
MMVQGEERLPVTLLTGFLGSGKTTLLNAWLRTTELAGAAVIVNEFGEVGIDHALIASSDDRTIELSTGCLCCTVRGDLVDTLRELTEKRASGKIRAFDRLVIETTGLADPAPVIQALMTVPVVVRYRLNQVITTVDAVTGLATLGRQPEAVKQAAVADEIIVTKTDLADDPAAATLTERLRALNPGARLHVSQPGRMPMPSELATSDLYDPATKSIDVVRWLNAEAFTQEEEHEADEHGHSHGHHGSGHAHRHAHGHAHAHRHDPNRHDKNIGSFCLTYGEPLAWEHVATWLDALVVAHGPDLLRVKGILDIEGRDQPIVLQAVQHLFHPPTMLPEWPAGPRRSQIVFITRGLSREFVAAVLDTVRGRSLAADPQRPPSS